MGDEQLEIRDGPYTVILVGTEQKRRVENLISGTQDEHPREQLDGEEIDTSGKSHGACSGGELSVLELVSVT
jgi:hypothetical protein